VARVQRAFAALSVSSIALALACTASAAAPRPTTLDSTRRPVALVAQDGQWLARARFCDGLSFTVRQLRTGRSSSAGRCGTGILEESPQFALASGRTLWNAMAVGNFTYNTILTASPSRRPRRVAELIYDNSDSTGDHLGAAAGDGPTLVFSSIRVGIDPATCDPEGFRCARVVEGGRVWRVVGARRVAVPDAPPSYLLAAWQRRIALVAADDVFARRRAGRSVEVRDAVTGRLVSRSVPAGTVQALALAPTYVALLVDGPSGRRIERRSAATGALLGSTRVSRSVERISASSYGVVFGLGRSIRTVDTHTGRARTLATTRAAPVGVSIETNRVVWAERVGSSRLIRALWLRD
jgi:hypothetical protein